MTNTKNMALIGIAASILIAGTAFAKPKADTNQDGQITKAEFVSAADAKFSKMDSNGDGVVTKEERKSEREARKQERSSNRFERLDANGDGFVSKDEYDAASNKADDRRKTRRDANGDGTVNKEDRKARKEMRKEHRKRMKAEGRIKPDANEDGVVTLAEHQAATDAMFLRLDVNGDGVLTKGEGKHRKRGKRGGRR